MNKYQIGKVYEAKARKYLSDNGYKILESNFRCKIGEIDIIAKDKEYLCFIEVKFRGLNSLEKAIEAVNKKKQKKIMKVAQVYILANKINEAKTPCRFDVISIDEKENKELDLKLIKNAFP